MTSAATTRGAPGDAPADPTWTAALAAADAAVRAAAAEERDRLREARFASDLADLAWQRDVLAGEVAALREEVARRDAVIAGLRARPAAP